MKLIYITSIIYPSTLANRIQILSMAEKFQSQLGDGFFLGGRDIKLEEGEYKINNLINFSSRRSYLLAWKYLNFIKGKNINFVYSREEKLLFFIIFFNFLFFREKLNYVYEAHFFPEKVNYIFKIIWKNCNKIIVLTSFIKNKFIGAGVLDEKVLVASDGVDLDMFDVEISRQEAKEKLKLPFDKKIITYTGSLDYYHSWKGADIFLETAGIFDNNFLFLVIGGKGKDIAEIKEKFQKENILILGHRPYKEIPLYLKASDVLVLPNKKGDKASEEYTSPMKMFEYMASGAPIVASDLPSIREILGEKNTILVVPNNPESLAEGIKKILQNKNLADKISKQALKDVQNHTWQKRAERILEFINN